MIIHWSVLLCNHHQCGKAQLGGRHIMAIISGWYPTSVRPPSPAATHSLEAWADGLLGMFVGMNDTGDGFQVQGKPVSSHHLSTQN